MKTIDIDHLSEPELVDLNRRIVERLRMLQAMHAHNAMMKFSVGQRVRFEPPGRGVVEGMVTRYNRKTVTVVTDLGEQWNVSPGALRASTSQAPKTIEPLGDVIEMFPAAVDQGKR